MVTVQSKSHSMSHNNPDPRPALEGPPLHYSAFLVIQNPSKWLSWLLDIAMEQGVLTPLAPKAARLRTSRYADDVALFVNPKRSEIAAVRAILERCEALDFDNIVEDFGGSAGSLPCRYLGLPPGLWKPRRVDILPIIDKMAGRLRGWKGKLLARPGRLALIKSVLTSCATYFLTYFAPNKWATKRMDKICRNFLWNGDEEASGGKCLVK
ncbi:uncharacterized protein [Aegilops tauschii subsp. strangulata]|uniref:uncharacterized protein n=1 Tax=Aegilops tauschii subsp. strangulata TaxID=200361 RepID=UPI00098B8CD1|nr:uncharacterized protein LOC109746177 [Aegilops tauschii subsp. strangulata]